MMREDTRETLLKMTVIFAILGMFFAAMGFFKMFVYENSGHSWEKSMNAYVNGDAYNYIINGIYFAGYSALSGAMFICACICGVQGAKIDEAATKQVRIAQTGHTQEQRKDAIAAYWDAHPEEFAALTKRRKEALDALAMWGLSIERRTALQNIISEIDEELNKDREP